MKTSNDDLDKRKTPWKIKVNAHRLFSRIGFRFISFVVLATLLSGGVISFMSIKISQDTVRREVLDHSHSQAHLAAEFTANYIEVIQANIRVFASRNSISNYAIESNTIEASEALHQFALIQTVLDTCGLYDNKGIQIANSDLNASTIGQSFADREWFQQSAATQQPFQSIPLQSRVTGNAVAPYAVPILNEQNQLLGTLCGAISLEKLSAVIEETHMDYHVNYSIFDIRNGGLIIANSDPQRILDSVTGYDTIVSLLSNSESNGIEFTDIHGEQSLIGFAPVPNLPWGVMITTPSEIAFASIRSLTQTASTISIAIVLIAAVIAGLLVLRITRPLRRLVEETEEIGKGNLDCQIDTIGNDEIGDLSRAFFDMKENLKKTMVSNETLEQKVKERTVELEMSNKDLESFSYSVSHDLRAPLRHVHGFVELLNDHLQEESDAETQHYLKVISTATNDMGQLIDGLLSFSRMGKSQIEYTKVNLNRLLKDVIAAFQSDLEGRKVKWSIADLPIVGGDIHMIKLALSNLISNALKFTSSKSPAVIEIGAEPDTENSDYVVIYIKDNGAGFDMQYKEKLFGVFQRLHSQKDYKGIGIGLANVKRIIQKHGGRVWADGVPDKGAVFYFTLPKYKEKSIC